MRRLSDEDGLCPTHDELAGVLGCAKSTVSQWRRQLQDLGLVRFGPDKRRGTRVTIDPAVLAASGLATARPSCGPVADLARFPAGALGSGGPVPPSAPAPAAARCPGTSRS